MYSKCVPYTKLSTETKNIDPDYGHLEAVRRKYETVT